MSWSPEAQLEHLITLKVTDVRDTLQVEFERDKIQLAEQLGARGILSSGAALVSQERLASKLIEETSEKLVDGIVSVIESFHGALPQNAAEWVRQKVDRTINNLASSLDDQQRQRRQQPRARENSDAISRAVTVAARRRELRLGLATRQGQEPVNGTIRLFISHSSGDTELATRLVNLLQSALRLPATSIRCTSVDGYRLPGGADTDEQLRREVHEAEAFIGIISDRSLRSLYVLFELGARWGARRHLVPLLAPGLSPSILGGPLAGLNALRADNLSQMHQLVAELGAHLSISPEGAAGYQQHLDAILQLVPEADVADTSEVDLSSNPERAPTAAASDSVSAHLSDDARGLLQEAGRDTNGCVLMTETMGGMSVEANQRNFTERGNPRSEARWRTVVLDLVERGLLEEQGLEGEIFRLTDLGYQVIDRLDS